MGPGKKDTKKQKKKENKRKIHVLWTHSRISVRMQECQTFAIRCATVTPHTRTNLSTAERYSFIKRSQYWFVVAD